MAKNSKNEILEEQRRAREEFLRLKKMQSGEMSAGPKPSEVAFVPKTFKEKRENFWFQYKWHTIGIIASVIVLAVLVAQCMSVPKYDFSVVYFTHSPVIDIQTDAIAAYFENMGEDINGDGEVKVQILNCSYANESGEVQYRNTQLQKLQAFMAGEHKAMLYITDEESIKFFDNIGKGEQVFDSEPLKLSKDFYNSTTTVEFGKLPDGLQISCRRISDTVMADNDTAKVTYKEASRIMEELKKAK